MAREGKLFGLFFVLLLLLHGSLTQARPFNILKSDRIRVRGTGFFDGLSLGAIKQSGPSPGGGNKFTDSGVYGRINSGPSDGGGGH
ncbi:hypothetical protein SADUNF_Sadunf07G0046400 [Salix dunnii]|uniref:Glycine-rich protein n=1 Tax=Salix dunnii TaxID=1413687 RepID=A0A835K1C1_9ROSI|nr:hypothetical protein SADUNF_Sadunf07G0046400 [Salix dunnii]